MAERGYVRRALPAAREQGCALGLLLRPGIEWPLRLVSATQPRAVRASHTLNRTPMKDASDRVDSAVFKGWAKPGPIIPRVISAPPDQTLDAISGYYRLFQLKKGHRFSTDDLLVAW